jgi:hypothetical protein
LFGRGYLPPPLLLYKEDSMPKVGKKEFPYTAKGMEMAKKEAVKKGAKVSKAAKSKMVAKKK